MVVKAIKRLVMALAAAAPPANRPLVRASNPRPAAAQRARSRPPRPPTLEMKVFGPAVARWWARTADVLAALGCLRAADEPHSPTLARSAGRADRALSTPPTLSPIHSPPLSGRSDATTVSLGHAGGDEDLAQLVGAFTSLRLPSHAHNDARDDARDEQLLPGCTDPEHEPELESEQETDDCGATLLSPAKTGALHAATDGGDGVRAAAVALANRLVPPTTATGRFETDPELPASPDHLAAKTAFADAARSYVLASAGRHQADDAAAIDTTTTATLVHAYRLLAASPLFEDEQRARDRQWEAAHARVNAAAFRLVHLAAQEPEPGLLLLLDTARPAAGQRPLSALHQRLDDAHALALVRQSEQQLARAPASAFLRVRTTGLSLLERRALLHAADASDTGATAWRRRLAASVRAAKQQLDARRRAHLNSDAGSSHACFFSLGPAGDQVLPLYAARQLERALVDYCDAEVETH